jgi:hypothetical protein
MPIVLGVAVALWMLLVLAVIGVIVVGTVVLAVIRRVLRVPHDEPGRAVWEPTLVDKDEDSAFDELDETGDWTGGGWSTYRPEHAEAWWWSPRGSPPELVIDTGHRPGASAVAERPATAKNQIWTIHPDHTAHFEDEATDCAWCRAGAA